LEWATALCPRPLRRERSSSPLRWDEWGAGGRAEDRELLDSLGPDDVAIEMRDFIKIRSLAPPRIGTDRREIHDRFGRPWGFCTSLKTLEDRSGRNPAALAEWHAGRQRVYEVRQSSGLRTVVPRVGPRSTLAEYLREFSEWRT
jgi:hypothetical protein